jgi:hypothetical protein
MNVRKTMTICLAILIVAGAPIVTRMSTCVAADRTAVKARLEIEASDDDFTNLKLDVKPKAESPAAKGNLYLWIDSEVDRTKVEVRYLHVDGQFAWMAGECTEDGDQFRDRWIYVVVHDGGEPGRLVDHIWIEWLDEGPEGQQDAEAKLVNLEKPSENRSIESGDIVVLE